MVFNVLFGALFRCCRWCYAPLCDFSVLSSILSWIGLSWGASLQRQRERKMEQFYTSKNKASDRLVCLRQQLSWFNDHTKNTLTHIAELPHSATPFTRNLSFALEWHGCYNFCGIKERCLWLDGELTQSHTSGHLRPWECKLKLKKCWHLFASPSVKTTPQPPRPRGTSTLVWSWYERAFLLSLSKCSHPREMKNNVKFLLVCGF